MANGFFQDDSLKQDVIPFGGLMVEATLDGSKLIIDFGTHTQGLLAVRSHVEQVRGIGVNSTPRPVASVETITPAPAPARATLFPATKEPAKEAAPVAKRRGRPPGSGKKKQAEAAS